MARERELQALRRTVRHLHAQVDRGELERAKLLAELKRTRATLADAEAKIRALTALERDLDREANGGSSP
ncbi:MAG: hypothetical protein ACFCBW_14905 [Candidatus Competibacterales bacterium]